MTNKNKKTFLIILFVLCFLPTTSFAADVSFLASKSSFKPGEEFLVQVFVDTKGVPVNAVEGSVLVPTQFLKVKEIRDGNSSINFWVEKPESTTDGKISFSGITAGGFTGSKIFLFGLVLEAEKEGSSSIALSDLQVFKNDGAGTKVDSGVTPFNFSISNNGTGYVQDDLTIKDSSAPENFVPFISDDATVFDGKHFVVFSTTDKGSGIDHFEVKESFWGFGGEYVIAESPYLLKDQTLKSQINIKAIDKSGNKRIVKIGAKNYVAGLEKFFIFVIILGICIFTSRRIRSKRSS